MVKWRLRLRPETDLLRLPPEAPEAKMAKKKEAAERSVQGNKLTCPVCSSTLFWTRTTLMNTAGLSFLDLDWANRSASNYVCDRCGYVFWFLERK